MEKGIIRLFFRIKNQNNCNFVAESRFMKRVVNIHTHHPTGLAIEPTAAGIHPWDAATQSTSEIESLISEADAIGEIGLDAACDVDIKIQTTLFRRQLSLAEKFDKPVILHCVRTFEQVMKILEEYHLRAVIFHGFIGSPEQAKRAIAKGYFLSFGERTFRSPKSIEALRSTPLEQLFLENDNSPIPIEKIYEQIADLLKISTNKLIEAIWENYAKIFLADN